MEIVEHAGVRYALILDRPIPESRAQFFTPDDAPLQVGAFNLPSGHEIQPHIHQEFERRLKTTTEVLLIQEGRLQVDFYDFQKQFVCSRTLDEGSIIVLFTGGHGFRALAPVRMIEVKQGPYAGDGDKRRFDRPQPSV